MVGVVPRVRNTRALAAGAESVRSAVTAVHVIRPRLATEAGLTLAATTQAIQDSIIYARTSGYLKRRYVDIGDRVQPGQVLAEIESPEIDAQLRQARANLLQAEKNLDLQKATRDLAKVTMDRYVAADAEKAVAIELVDQNIAAFRTAEAAVAAAEATVEANRATVQQFDRADIVSARARAVRGHGSPAERRRGRLDYGWESHRQHGGGADESSPGRRTGCSRWRRSTGSACS